MNKKILLHQGTVVTFEDNNRVLKDHSVSMQNGKILKVAPSSEFKKEEFDEVIDAKRKLIMPGFINAHMHYYSSMARGLGKAAPSTNFPEVLENLWWRLDKKLTLEDTYLSTLVASIDAIKKGTTTLIDHHASPHAVRGSLTAVKKGMKAAGLRGSLCYELSDRDGDKVAKEGIEENLSMIRECKKEKDDQFHALFGMHASFTITDKTMRAAVLKAKELDAGFHIHTAEDISDQKKTLELCGKRVVERLHKQGILGPKTICAHAVWVDDEEIELLSKTRTIVVHNPQSNMNNAVGVANIFKMHQKGILLGLGTDAMTVNMIEELRACIWMHHLAKKNPSVGFMEITGLLTQNNKKIANRFFHKVGEVTEGFKADLILMDYDPPTPMDESNFLGHLVFGLSNGVVDTTIASGKILMRGKVLMTLDEEKIMAECRAATKRLWERF